MCVPPLPVRGHHHGRMAPEDKLESGIRQGLLRLAVGMEHADDLIADLAQAMA